ncbi:hypothetical protein BVH65_07370 [Vibrio cholerae]|nr:hypothetical protein [Vibrio cholerae]MBO1369797.1 hypothetical protein [Vibrio cholerae]MBO1372544.1 hypothetical protein [Vibrio cholerae]MBO1377124.1 hypothetical protein [Vibrio cholerae]MBO1406119.1 hypothetical protein [Vibrio cholerae]
MGLGEFRRIIFSSIHFLLEAASVLAEFAHPNHRVYLCSWGFTHLPPTCNTKSFRYITAGSDTHLKTKKGRGCALCAAQETSSYRYTAY